MIDPKNTSKFDHLIEHLIGYLDTKSEILKLELREELVKILSRLIASLMVVLLLTLVALFASVALGNYLNHLWNSTYLGYAILAGTFLLLSIVMLLLKQTPWYHKIIGYFTDRILTGTGKKRHASTED